MPSPSASSKCGSSILKIFKHAQIFMYTQNHFGIQQGLEIHGLEEHGPWRYTVFNWISKHLRYTVFDQKPWRCTVFSFDVLDSSLVKEFTSFMLILRQISNFFTVTKGFKVWFIFNLILLCASMHILCNKKKQINHFHLCQLYVFNLPASS